MNYEEIKMLAIAIRQGAAGESVAVGAPDANGNMQEVYAVAQDGCWWIAYLQDEQQYVARVESKVDVFAWIEKLSAMGKTNG